MRRRSSVVPPVALCLGLLPAAVPAWSDAAAGATAQARAERAAQAAADPRAQAWDRAVAEHPDDPDLLLGSATQREASGDLAGAVEQLERFTRRWPERRPDLWLRLGRLLQRLERDSEAVPAVEHALRDGSDLAATHLHLGISLRRLGRSAEAEAHFEAAARLEPQLLPEASLLRALAHIDLGDTAGAVPYLERTIEVDPNGEAARSARLLLHARRAGERPPWYRLDLWGGYETDTNVTLEGSTDLPNASPDRDDPRAVWGAGLTLRPIRGRRIGLVVGVRYDQAEQADLSSFDTRRELAFASLRWALHERVSLRLDALATRTRLDHRRYQRTRSLHPAIFLGWGQRIGVTRVFAEWEQVSYPETVLLDSLVRDGWTAGGGVDHFWSVPRLPGAWISLGADFQRYRTDSERDVLGFESPYDEDRYRLTTRIRGPRWLGFETEASFSVAREQFAHRNVLDLLIAGNLDPSARRDTVLEGRFSLVRPVTRYADLEFRLQ